jgi:hypothetical protein
VSFLFLPAGNVVAPLKPPPCLGIIEPIGPLQVVTVHNQAVGRTAGEALDGLTAQLPAAEVDTLIVIGSLGPDRFFTGEQRQRLAELMARWRSVRDEGKTLSDDEQSELANLIDTEVRAAAERAAAVHRESVA